MIEPALASATKIRVVAAVVVLQGAHRELHEELGVEVTEVGRLDQCLTEPARRCGRIASGSYRSSASSSLSDSTCPRAQARSRAS